MKSPEISNLGILKAGVIGDPIAHSLSPIIHHHWLEKYGIAGHYEKYRVPPDGLAAFIESAKASNMAGFNVTLPHKQAIIPFCDDLTDEARNIGAVNLVTIDDKGNDKGKLTGHNSDLAGFTQNLLDAQGFKQNHKTDKAVLLGAGGAAYAVMAGLIDLGFKHIIVLNRSQGRADALVKHFERYAGDQGIIINHAPWETREAQLANCDLLVNSTALGMIGKAELALDLALLPEHAWVNDIVYQPLMTNLLIKARARGNKIQDGLGMLLHQAAPAFQAWFAPDQALPIVDQALRDAVLNALHTKP